MKFNFQELLDRRFCRAKARAGRSAPMVRTLEA